MQIRAGDSLKRFGVADGKQVGLAQSRVMQMLAVKLKCKGIGKKFEKVEHIGAGDHQTVLDQCEFQNHKIE